MFVSTMAASPAIDQAFVTLATNDTYCMGALVLANSLRQAGTTKQLAVMISNQVSQGMREQLHAAFNNVVVVDVLDSRDTMNLELLTRPDLGVTFTKLHCWRLTQYTKCVFLDADTYVLTNVDELFDREELSAAPDAGWPDCFNSGVFVFVPSEETYSSLLNFALTFGSFDGGDQGLLNSYFKDWATKDIARHLPFVYNCVSQAFYSYLPAFKQFGSDVKIAHFIGPVKPWHHAYNTATGNVTLQSGPGHNSSFLQQWWDTFMATVQPKLDPSLTNITEGMSSLKITPGAEGYSKAQLDDVKRQELWDRGQIDYTGIDKFENIQSKLDEVLKAPPAEPTDLFSKGSSFSKS